LWFAFVRVITVWQLRGFRPDQQEEIAQQ
jgi:hypothetical protein